MNSFEYVMVLVSIVVGLGVTHTLTGLGAAVHRLRGNGAPIKLSLTYLSWVAFVFLWLVSFWWWEFKLAEVVKTWTFGIYLLVTGYAVVLFLLAVVLVPRDLEGVGDSDVYFLAIRGWFFGLLLVANAFDVADSFLKGPAWVTKPMNVSTVGIQVAVAIVGIATKSKWLHMLMALAALISLLVVMFVELGVLGSW